MKFDQAIKKLLEKNSYYGTLLGGTRRCVNRSIPTACVKYKNGVYQIEYNPDFFAECKDEVCPGLIEHEVLHIFHGHNTRRAYISANPKRWNIAADMAINPLIDCLKEMESLVFPDQYDLPESKSAEFYYDKMPEDVEDSLDDLPNFLDEACGDEGAGKVREGVSQPGDGGQPGDGEEGDSPEEAEENSPQGRGKGEDREEGEFGAYDDPPEGMVNEHGWEEEDSKKDRVKDSKLADTVETTEEEQSDNDPDNQGATRSRGQLPGNAKEHLDDIAPIESGLPWYSLIHNFFRRCGSVELKAFMKFKDRRYGIRPQIRTVRRLRLMIAIDTSGSVQTWYIKKALGELDRITDFCDITLVQCDTKIHDVKEYRGELPDIQGRGGTNFKPVFDYYEENANRHSGLVYFTDGFAPFPDEKQYPVMWVYPPNHDECMWGSHVTMEREESDESNESNTRSFPSI